MATSPTQAVDPYASIATPVAASDPYASIATQIPPESTMQKAASSAGEFGAGIIPGMVESVGETIQALPWVGKKIISPEAMTAERAYFAPGSAAEKYGQTTGHIAEPLLEFVLGDEALKGLALADKIGLAGKIAKVAQDSPYIGKLLQHGVNAARMGTVGTTEALAKGATVPEALKTGVATGVGGEAISSIPEVASGFRGTNPFRAVASKFTGSDIQPTLKSGIQDVWNNVAEKAGIPKPTSASVQDLGQEVGDSILARSKANYKLVDDATEGRFSGTEQALKSVNQDLRSVTNDTEEQNLMVRKTRLEMQMNQMMDEAVKKGVPKSTIDAAKADFKQAQSIYDTNHQIRMSTTGVRPGMQGAADVREEVNAKNLMNRLNKLYNKDRLQQAVGDDGAEDLIGHSATAQKAARDVARNRKVAGIVGGVVGVPAVGTAVVEGVRHAME